MTEKKRIREKKWKEKNDVEKQGINKRRDMVESLKADKRTTIVRMFETLNCKYLSRSIRKGEQEKTNNNENGDHVPQVGRKN